MSFPQYVSDAALAACGRCCCICHKFCGTKMELHHIKQVAYGGEDTFENCIPLCFDCHADMGKADPKHNKGKKYSEAELVMHRDNWYRSVAKGMATSHEPIADKDHICEEDRLLFRKICDVFTSDISYWIMTGDMNHPYDGKMFTALDLLLVKDNDPCFAFINPECEKLKKQLFDSIEDFLDVVSMNTFHIGPEYPELHAGRLWLLNHGYIDDKLLGGYEKATAVFKKQTDHMSKSAKKLWEDYCAFVKRVRLLLSI